MHMLQRGPYWAWITIQGGACNVHDVRHSGNLVTCWIPSEAGKKFAVNWYNSTREIPLKASVYIDGVHCDTHIMLDAHNYPNKPNGVGVSYARTSEYTRRDFVFAPIQVTDDDDFLDRIDDSRDLGVIKLQLWRIQVLHVSTRVQEHEYGRPTLEAQIVHERSKKAGSHHVQFGQEYASPAPVIDAVQVKEIDIKPYITFEFKYRPIELLMANDIAPRTAPMLYTLSPSPECSGIPSEEPKFDSAFKEISHLEVQLNTLRAQRLNKSNGRHSKRIKHEHADTQEGSNQVTDST